MSFEEFKNLASGIQSIVISIGFLSGGLWAIFRFKAFKEPEKAKAELDKINKSLQERGTIKLTITPIVISLKDTKYIEFSLTIQNTGNRNETLNLQNGMITISSCSWSEIGKIKYSNVQTLNKTSPQGRALEALIRPSQVTTFSYISSSIDEGIYSIDVSIPGSPETEQDHEKDSLYPNDPNCTVTWICNKVIAVNK